MKQWKKEKELENEKVNVEKKERREKWYRKEVLLYRSIWETQAEISNKAHGACKVGKKKMFSEGK